MNKELINKYFTIKNIKLFTIKENLNITDEEIYFIYNFITNNIDDLCKIYDKYKIFIK